MPERSEFFVRAASFVELLGPDFETTRDGGDARLANERWNAWRQSAADGESTLFERRLARDGWDPAFVSGRLHGATPGSDNLPQWFRDADWIHDLISEKPPALGLGGEFPFADLFVPLVNVAGARLWKRVGLTVAHALSPSARRDIHDLLMKDLTDLFAPLLYERFVESALSYCEFVAQTDLTAIVAEKPVLLRLVATLVRQWLVAMEEFIQRLSAESALHDRSVGTPVHFPAVRVYGNVSDRHEGGRSVLIVEFVDGHRIVYKPRDQMAAVSCGQLLDWLNTHNPPARLRVPRTVARPGYGWNEYIAHAGCRDSQEVRLFFRRAGAWLSLLHCLVATDMHHENMIAAADHPIPIDLECILQEGEPAGRPQPEQWADEAARSQIADSVLAVGLLPGYARGSARFQPVGGLAAGWDTGMEVRWRHMNSDDMHPVWEPRTRATPNLPHIGGEYTSLRAHVEDFLAGFADYAAFLSELDWSSAAEEFRNIAVRKVTRPTQFYQLLLGRLRDDRTMSDGILWSVQADFVARLADWNVDADPRWSDVSKQRDALLELTVPIFSTESRRGLERMRSRVADLDGDEINRQIEIIRQTSSFTSEQRSRVVRVTGEMLTIEEIGRIADDVARDIASCAIRRGPAAAWTGLTWSTDSDASQLVVLGDDLYSGNGGIAVFLAAHARVRGCERSADLARAALARLRAEINGGNAARMARLLGIGGGSGMGSVVYALSVIARILGDDSLQEDANRAAALISAELIARDGRCDAISGSAGAILGLLRLHRDSGSVEALPRAILCADHLLAQRPLHTWTLDGMAHGTAGVAYALAALAAASGREDHARVSHEFSGAAGNGCCDGPQAQSQWCHGAAGMGLSLIGQRDCGTLHSNSVAGRIEHALCHAFQDWPGRFDTLCCGSLGNLEFLRAAGHKEVAQQRLSAVLRSSREAGSPRWNGGTTRFNLGLHRGLSGVGYACLRTVDESLPNVLVWE